MREGMVCCDKTAKTRALSQAAQAAFMAQAANGGATYESALEAAFQAVILKSAKLLNQHINHVLQSKKVKWSMGQKVPITDGD